MGLQKCGQVGHKSVVLGFGFVAGLAVDLAATGDPAECQAMVLAAIDEALENLSRLGAAPDA